MCLSTLVRPPRSANWQGLEDERRTFQAAVVFSGRVLHVCGHFPSATSGGYGSKQIGPPTLRGVAFSSFSPSQPFLARHTSRPVSLGLELYLA
jgi:hypothetical protein